MIAHGTEVVRMTHVRHRLAAKCIRLAAPADRVSIQTDGGRRAFSAAVVGGTRRRCPGDNNQWMSARTSAFRSKADPSIADIRADIIFRLSGPEVDISPGTKAFFRTCVHLPKALI